MINLIVKFNSETDRQEFISRTKEFYPQLLEKGYMAKRRPDMVLEDLPDEDKSLVDELVGELGKVFEDVKFETMDP